MQYNNLILKSLSPLLIVSIFFLDRMTKGLILEKMYLGQSIEVFPFFQITYVRNTGVAFGLGQNRNQFFILVTSILVVILFMFQRFLGKNDRQNLKLKTGLALVIGGALGNLYDRMVYGSVIDFLDFFLGSYHWPAFNIADASICIGTFLLFLPQWLNRKNCYTHNQIQA